jgi:hypothetical protein
MATTIGTAPHTVTIDECTKIVDGKQMKYHIRGTELYFVRWGAARQNAHDLVLKKRLTESEFNEKMEIRKRITKANSAIKVHECMLDTKKYIERWEGIISLNNKKRLCEDLKEKLEIKLALGKFKNIGQAKGVIAKHKKR